MDIPQYGSTRVSLQPQPNMVLSGNSINASAGAFGGAQADQMGDLGQVLQQAGGQALDEINVAKARDAVNNAREQMRQITVGAMQSQGVGADGITKSAKQQFSELRKQIAGKLDNPMQTDMFGKVFDSYAQGELDSMASHEAAETRRYIADTRSATISNNIQDAALNYANPEKLNLLKLDSVNQARQNVLANGGDENMARAEILKVTNAHHMAVAQQMAVTDPARAATYLQQNVSEMEPTVAAKAAQQYKAFADAEMEQSEARNLLAKHGGDVLKVQAEVDTRKDLSEKQKVSIVENAERRASLNAEAEAHAKQNEARGITAQLSKADAKGREGLLADIRAKQPEHYPTALALARQLEANEARDTQVPYEAVVPAIMQLQDEALRDPKLFLKKPVAQILPVLRGNKEAINKFMSISESARRGDVDQQAMQMNAMADRLMRGLHEENWNKDENKPDRDLARLAVYDALSARQRSENGSLRSLTPKDYAEVELELKSNVRTSVTGDVVPQWKYNAQRLSEYVGQSAVADDPVQPKNVGNGAVPLSTSGGAAQWYTRTDKGIDEVRDIHGELVPVNRWSPEVKAAVEAARVDREKKASVERIRNGGEGLTAQEKLDRLDYVNQEGEPSLFETIFGK